MPRGVWSKPRPKVDVAVRILARLDRVYGDVPAHAPELGPCWPFMGARLPKGYGRIRDNDGRLRIVSRIVLEMALKRPLRPGMRAAHKCDNPPCARPSHLEEKTELENVWDIMRRGNHKGFENNHGRQESSDDQATV